MGFVALVASVWAFAVAGAVPVASRRPGPGVFGIAAALVPAALLYARGASPGTVPVDAVLLHPAMLVLGAVALWPIERSAASAGVVVALIEALSWLLPSKEALAAIELVPGGLVMLVLGAVLAPGFLVAGAFGRWAAAGAIVGSIVLEVLTLEAIGPEIRRWFSAPPAY